MNDDPQAHAPSRDCWRRVGVAGDRTCPRLAEARHCRNCPEYAAVAAEMLDREPPEGYVREWTDILAREKEIETRGAGSAVIFQVGRETLALPADVCREVVEDRPMHTIPHRSDDILLGLVNVRGEVLLCASLAGVLGIERDDDAPRRILVVEKDADRWALLVDAVHGIQRFSSDELRNVPVTLAKADRAHTKGVFTWRDRSVGRLDEDALFESLGRSLL